MELEVIGRHALLFDEDASANFVNSKEALVEWNSLFIDRYDVRHLLSSPPRSFNRLPHSTSPSPLPDSHLQSQLDLERFADLPSSDQQLPEMEDDAATASAGTYHSVSFSYGNTAESTEPNNDDRNSEGDGFCPPFPVPENLARNLPSTEKLHQIIARTALFVGQHGGQSEIVLRVKQGDNPTFGFLMPHHHLHPYFRYLVDHPDVLKASIDDKSLKGNDTDHQSGSPDTGGALSLLGSVYGSVEDEDVAPEDAKESKVSKDMVTVGTTTGGDITSQQQSKKRVFSENVSQKDERSSKLIRPSKDKALALSKSGVSSTSKSKSANGKKEDALGSSGADVNNSKLSARSSTANGESLVIEPPSELKRLVDRIVEIILKNGEGFESLLIDQDKNHRRFPFLLSSNQYHSYYRKILRMAQESRVGAKNFGSDKDAERKQSEESTVQDIPFACDKKEKFTMVIPKNKREIQEQPSKEPQQPSVSISTDAVAAILQAATRGIKKPSLDILSKKHGSGGDGGGQASSLGSQQSSQPQSSLQTKTDIELRGVPVSFAKKATMAAAGEADSSEAGLTREQKLKAERLKRAKLFAAMIKSGAVPRGSSAEPPRSGVSGSGVMGTQEAKDREGSTAPADAGTSHKLEKSEKHMDYTMDEKDAMKKRHYRSSRHRKEEESDGENDRHTRKKHRSHHSSRNHRDRSEDRHKDSRRHSSSKDKESRHRRHKHDKGSEDEDDHHHKYSSSENEYESSKHKRRSSERDAYRDERRRKHKKRSNSEGGYIEEGEIRAKSVEQSSVIGFEDGTKEKSVDRVDTQQEKTEQPQTTDVPDDLRAKIRAMLLATL